MGQLTIEFDNDMEVSENTLALGSRIILPEIIRQLNELAEKTAEKIEKHYEETMMSRVYWELKARYDGFVYSIDDEIEDNEGEDDVKSALVLRFESDCHDQTEEFPIDLRCGFDMQEIKGVFKKFRDAVVDEICKKMREAQDERIRESILNDNLRYEIRKAKERVWGTKRFSEISKEVKAPLMEAIKEMDIQFDIAIGRDEYGVCEAVIKTLRSFQPDGEGSFTYTKAEPKPEPKPEPVSEVYFGNPLLLADAD